MTTFYTNLFSFIGIGFVAYHTVKLLQNFIFIYYLYKAHKNIDAAVKAGILKLPAPNQKDDRPTGSGGHFI